MVATNNLNNRLIAGLQQIIASGIDLPLVPIGTHKQPLGDNWQNRPYKAAQLIEALQNGGVEVPIKGEIKKLQLGGFGVITGLPVTVEGISYYLMALDQDGESAIAIIDQLGNGKGVPPTVAFTSGRPGRCQYLFLVPSFYKDLIRTKKLKTAQTGDDDKPEQLEFRFANMQSVLPPSIHPVTGVYHWIEGAALGEVPIAIAPPWVISQMLINMSRLEGQILPLLHKYDIPLKVDSTGTKIDGSIIERLHKKVDLLSVIGEYIPLYERGKNYVGHCPVHESKAPNLMVYPDKKMFTCHDCGIGGNIFNFLQLLGKSQLKETITPQSTPQKRLTNNNGHHNFWSNVDWALSYLNALSPFRADDYDDWLTVGMALHSVDDSLLKEWDNWSRSSSKYKPGECEKKWKSFSSGGGVSLGTLAHLAKSDGWRSPFENNHRVYSNGSKNIAPSSSERNFVDEHTVNQGEPTLAQLIEEILAQNFDDATQDLALVELAKSYDNYNPSEIRAIANKLIDARHEQDYLSERKAELEQLEEHESFEYLPFDDIFYDCPDVASAFKYACQVNKKIQPQYFLGILPVTAGVIGVKGEVMAPVLGKVKGTLNLAIVGESGEGKSIVSKILISPLYRLQKEMMEQHKKQKSEYEEALNNWNRQHRDYRPAKPTESDYITTTDALLVISEYSREGIVANHVDNPNGFLIYQEEMVSLQRAQNMYRQGKGDDRQFLNNLYDNGPISRALKSERREVSQSAVSTFGGYQPDIILGQMGDLSDPDGQWARCNFVFGIEKKVHTRLNQPSVCLDDLFYNLYKKALFAPSIQCRFDSERLKYLEKFVNEMEDARWSCLESGMRAVYSKASGEVMRIALLLHWINCLLKGVPVAPIIPAIAVLKAIKIKKFFISQIAIIRTWGKSSPRSEEGLAPLYRTIQKIAARLEGIEEVLTTRRVLAARVPIFKGLKAKDIEKLFKDLAAMGKATLVKWKRGIALSIKSLLDGMDKSTKPGRNGNGGSPIDKGSDDRDRPSFTKDGRGQRGEDTSEYIKPPASCRLPPELNEIVAPIKNSSSSNTSSVVLPIWGSFAQTAETLLIEKNWLQTAYS
ncbi:DUF3987 domain-containing protein [Gloeothece verrucosa]|uniref:Primase 2 n=1 Tax=Gloeothece verrucosa (strain PCC 7822) TaxID=497965 RepID=E0ULT2_GLOV7|nr:DUF3987 domain-containing protein [Gloeothece verrucosa]ADN17912.1 Primase 2 [Gloeothece verrucosa PCC 7822]